MDFIFPYVYLWIVCGYVQLDASAYGGQQRASDPGMGVTGSCELSNMGIGDSTQVLCQRIMSSYTLNHLSSSQDFFYYII